MPGSTKAPTEIVLVPVARITRPAASSETIIALFEVAVIGERLVKDRTPPEPTPR